MANGTEIFHESLKRSGDYRAHKRGKFFISVSGKGKTTKELQSIGNDMKDRITQQFVYNKVVSGLKEKGYVMVGEELEGNHTVHVLLRRFV